MKMYSTFQYDAEPSYLLKSEVCQRRHVRIHNLKRLKSNPTWINCYIKQWYQFI